MSSVPDAAHPQAPDGGNPDPDAEAMLACAAGDEEAFAGVVDRYQGRLVNFFLRSGASLHEAEDWAQETFLRVYRWRARYRPTARFATFLFTLARHVRVDALRKAGRTVDTTGGELEPERHAEPGDPIAARDLALDLGDALAALSESHRNAVILHVYEGLNYAEIATIEEVPEGTIKSRMYHALRRLRAVLEAGGHTG